MSRRTRDLAPRILQRRAESGLGVACAEAQADGVPCSGPECDCASCEHGAAAVAAETALAAPPARASGSPP